ncbi:MAG TPA: response regulator [Candidatus Eremiobacteraeota bacterium]|nr:MAG: Response regulator MprA [bacterium ADurb.Bin363]HPZ06945.1 response regulator [Candidatus Eremiobacteraeota bacterium]
MEEKINELINQLTSKDENARKEAIWLLGKLGNPMALKPLTCALLKDEIASVRELAAKALGDLGFREASTALCDALMDPSPGVQKQVVINLGKLGDKRVIEQMERLLSDPVIRVEVAQSLALLGKSDGIIAAIKDDNSAIAARAAECAGVIKFPEIIPVLIDVLSSEEWKVRRNATESLGKLREKSAVEPISRILLKDESYEARSVAAEALGKIGDEKCLGDLLKALEDPHWEVRKNVAEALGKLGNPSATPYLIKALSDSDWNTRFNALNALGVLNDSSAGESIINSLKDESKNVRSQAAKVLAELWKSQARKPIMEHLELETDPWVKNYITQVIEELPKDEELKKYRVLLADDDKFISKLLTQTFELEGFIVEIARNGKEALDKASTYLPDIIILDIMMPEMDGWEVCEQLKLNPRTGAIPIIILTAKSQDKDIEKSKSLGVAHYFSKPFDNMELIKTVKHILNAIKG